MGQDLVKEFQRFDNNPAKHFQKASFTSQRGSKQQYSVDVGYEQFLAPELFFNPEIFSSDFTSMVKLVSEAIC